MRIPDNIIEKGVDLWCKALHYPKFDNGDESLNGVICTMLASANIGREKANVSDMKSRIEKFRNILVRDIKKLYATEGVYLSKILATDYGPCQILADAATQAGIPFSQFSVKSSVSLCEDRVCARFGYSTPFTYYYPIPDGRWLVTDLDFTSRDINKSDGQKIIKHILNGNDLGFTVEK